MSILLHGDCLELMKTLDDDSVDLIFCDLPYGQTSCKWDCPIDLDLFWLEVMRMILCGLSQHQPDSYLRRRCL